MMTAIASIIGAVIFGTIGSVFVNKTDKAQAELGTMAWGLVGVIVMIVIFSQFGLIN